MKKVLLILTVVILISAGALAVYLFRDTILPEKELVLDQTNKTFVVKGDVKIKKAAPGAEWQKMDTSVIVEKGDIIETSEGSTVDVVIGKNTDKAVKIDEKSRVEFERVNPARLNFTKGKIYISLKKLEPKSSFVVKTPTAICGAQGTAWAEEASADVTKVYVFENSIYARTIDAKGNPSLFKNTVDQNTERILKKDEPISKPMRINQDVLDDWNYWSKNITFLREDKVLLNDFNKKENFNNLKGPFGSWVVFYSDQNQYCRDEFTPFERRGDTGYGLKVSYDVDSPFSAYNGFFSNLMGIDLSEYKYLVFYIKGDKKEGFTTKLDVELKNKFQIGRIQVKGITDEWKKIVLPFEKFSGITEFRNMKELVILFSDINVTKKVGVIYLDDIYFSKNETVEQPQ